LPTNRELIGLVKTRFSVLVASAVGLVVLCAPRCVETGAAPVTWRPLVR